MLRSNIIKDISIHTFSDKQKRPEKEEVSGPIIEIGIGKGDVLKDSGALKTILGSCIGVVLYDEKNKVGGMAHVMLPRKMGTYTEWSRFGNTAVEGLVAEMLKLGADRKKIRAFICGGAVMFPFVKLQSDGDIGWKNYLSVKKSLETEGIPIIKEDISGYNGRRVVFDVGTGKCDVYKMQNSNFADKK